MLKRKSIVFVSTILLTTYQFKNFHLVMERYGYDDDEKLSHAVPFQKGPENKLPLHFIVHVGPPKTGKITQFVLRM